MTVLDSSVVLCWFFADQATSETGAVLRSVEADGATCPDFLLIEVANVRSIAVRHGTAAVEDATAFLDMLLGLPIGFVAATEIASPVELAILAVDTGLSDYDALFLAHAAASNRPLASVDRKLADVARSRGIAVVPR